MTRDAQVRRWAIAGVALLALAYVMLSVYGVNFAGMGRFSSFGMYLVNFMVMAGVVLLPVALIAWLVLTFANSRGPGRSRAIDIAEERYARGEIDRQQLEEMRDVLNKR